MPTAVYLEFSFYPGTEEVGFDVNLRWFDKTATRLPEASWILFDLPGRQEDSSAPLLVSVLDQQLDATDVAANGGVHDHYTWGGQGRPNVAVGPKKGGGGKNQFELHSSDTGMVAFPLLADDAGELNSGNYNVPSAYPTQGDWSTGGVNFSRVGVNLNNNLWNTAFWVLRNVRGPFWMHVSTKLGRSSFRGISLFAGEWALSLEAIDFGSESADIFPGLRSCQ